MYVYLLKHAHKPTFKIGKAINIHNRIPEIGGYESFDLDTSLCAQFQNERLALKHETFIHQVFEEWNLDPVEKNRLPGDTEHFKIECFDQVVDYLRSNAHFFKCKISPIPKKPDIPHQVGISKDARSARRKLKKELDRRNLEHNNMESANSWDLFLGCLVLHENQILQELPSEENGLVITLGINRRQFETSGLNNVGRCSFDYHFHSQSGCFGYGVIGCSGLNSEHMSNLYLLPVSEDNMNIVKKFGLTELTAKIEAVNEWIRNRRNGAQVDVR